MFQVCAEQVRTKKDLSFFILYYMYKHQNIPFNSKSLSFALKSLGYKKSYVAISLSKLRRLRFLSEPEVGIYVMTGESFDSMQRADTKLAQEIKYKVTNSNIETWQKYIS